MVVVNFIFYYFIIIPISLLPFRILYVISDGLSFFFYYVIGYRKRIVSQNIRNSFPDKTNAEQKLIAKRFYNHFCDLIVESLKIFTISEKDVHKRMICRNPEVINKYFEKKQNVIIAGGHYNNWEIFAVAVDKMIKHQPVGIYMPLSNKFFDDKMQKSRSKYGLKMISAKNVRDFFEVEKNNLNAVIFAIDQSPSNPAKGYWTKFLNQDTCVLTGTEKYAVEFDYPVLFGRAHKIRRGYYVLEFEEACINPIDTSKGEIIEKITLLLERDIIKAPEYWLWSHRRWKHKRPVEKLYD